MTLCMNCKYCAISESKAELSRCTNPVTIAESGVSVINGEIFVRYRNEPNGSKYDWVQFAETMRGVGRYCGPDATLFEPKADAEVAGHV